jgi:hypothetical protein
MLPVPWLHHHPLDPISVCLYVSFMCNPPGSAVLHATSERPVKDRNQLNVKAKGTWTSPNSLYKLASVIRALHSVYCHLLCVGIMYSPSYNACVKMNSDHQVNLGQSLVCMYCFNVFGKGCTETSGCVLLDPTLSQHLKGTRVKLGDKLKAMYSWLPEKFERSEKNYSSRLTLVYMTGWKT